MLLIANQLRMSRRFTLLINDRSANKYLNRWSAEFLNPNVGWVDPEFVEQIETANLGLGGGKQLHGRGDNEPDIKFEYLLDNVYIVYYLNLIRKNNAEKKKHTIIQNKNYLMHV